MDKKAAYAKCEQCPLKDAPFAPAHGDSDADVLVVSRSPSYRDCMVGRPFSGPSGKLLDHLLELHGVQRSSVWTTNVVLCHTDKPDKQAIECCRPRLEKEIENVQPKTIIAAGAEACRAVVGLSTNAARRSGELHSSTGIRVVGTYNPAAALRDDTTFPDLVRDFKRALTPRKLYTNPTIHVHDDPWVARKVAQTLLKEHQTLAIDIESTGLSQFSDIICVGISGSDSEGHVFTERCRNAIHDAVSSREHTYIFHNGKFDTKVLREKGYPARVDEDTMLLSYACDERPGVHSLDYLVENELDWLPYEPESVKKGKRNGFKDFTDWSDLYEYNGYDVVGCYQLFGILSARAAADGVREVYERLLIPGSEALTAVERLGIRFDTRHAEQIREHEIEPELVALRERINFLAGREVNPNSSQQLGAVLYDEMRTPEPVGRRGRNRSVDRLAREEILRGTCSQPARDLIRELDDFKRLDKLRSTYLQSLIGRVDHDGRLHCDFLLHGTETGRLSSRGPNLQNQPRGKLIRQLYVASPGCVLLQADYSQAELRTAAMLSGDETLQQIYIDDRDLHTEVATRFYGEHFTSEQRVRAKTVNFGILYGQGASSFQTMHQMPFKEAKRIVDEWWHTFPQVRKWVASVHKEVQSECELSSAFGRKRRFHLLTDQNLHHSLKEGVNFLVQSPASDFTLYSLIALHARGLTPLLTVHDSLLFEVLESSVDRIREEVIRVMENAAKDTLGWTLFPMSVDVKTGQNWGIVS